MLSIRPSSERGHASFGWLDSRHTFSFGHYHDQRHMGFGALRVINEDRVKPGAGFGTHGHENMEIISYVLEGALEHRDSLGTGSVIRPGDVQRMTAGTGIRHSEFNNSDTAPLHFLQIWILPEQNGLDPSYEERTFPLDNRSGQLRLLGSRDRRKGSVTIHQDVDLYRGVMEPGDELEVELVPGRQVWIQVVRGAFKANDRRLTAGDGAAVSTKGAISFTADEDAEFLLFDLAA